MTMWTRLVVGSLIGLAAAATATAVAAGADRAELDGAEGAEAVVGGAVWLEVDGLRRLMVGDQVVRVTGSEVVGLREVPLDGSDVRVLLWGEREGGEREGGERAGDGVVVPWYSVSLDGRSFKGARGARVEMALNYARFDPVDREPVVSDALSADGGCSLHLVQFVTQPLGVYRDALSLAGAKVLKFMPYQGVLVSMDADVRGLVSAMPFVRWVGPLHPAYRIESFLLENWSRLDVVAPLQRYRIRVVERGSRLKDIVANRIGVLGGRVDVNNASGFLLEATLTPDQLSSVIRMNEVSYVDRWSPIEDDMDLAREIGGANFLEAVEGYSGKGVRAEVMDGNVYSEHQDFASRPFTFHGPHGGADSHGTGTTGIVFGDGTGNPQWEGMLPDGQPIFADNNGFTSGADRYALTADLSQGPYFAVFQSNSWGNQRTTQYTNVSAEFDDILFLNDILICQSQSNAGNQDSRPQAWAKNVVSVGGVYHQGTLTTADDAWSGGFGGSASIGPAADGRIKPYLIHFYDGITTLSDSGGYGGFCCTSGATPVVAGYFGLFFEMWHDGIFDNVTNGTVFDSRPHMSTSKAMLINSARSYAFSGPASDLTRTHQGWGMPNVKRLYDARGGLFVVDETDVLTNLSSTVYELVVPEDEPALRVTLVYTDPAGSPGSAMHRVNDLTLRVTSPDETVYFGNNGLLSGNWSTPGGVSNTIDTVENVFVQDPSSGVWTVEVLADEINEDSHLETAAVDADYALVVSGIVPVENLYSYFDADVDGDVDGRDFGAFVDCVTGPLNDGGGVSLSPECAGADCDRDNDVDLADYACFSRTYTGGCGVALTSALPEEVFSCFGSSVSFEVGVEGEDLNYRWYKNGEAVNGASGSTLELNGIGASSAGDYHVFVWSDCGMTVSSLSTLLVSVAPEITGSPEDAVVCVGEMVTLTCAAVGADPLSYRWQRDSVDIEGADESVFVIESASLDDLGGYRCVVSDECGLEAASDEAQLVTVNVDVETPPQDVDLCAGELLFLTVETTGLPESYQWFKDGAAIDGATELFLLIGAVTPGDAGSYTVEVFGPCDSVVSEAAIVAVSDCP